MTLAVDSELEWSVGDRRRVSGGPRRSWASTQPAVVRETDHNDAVARSRQWTAMVRRIQARAVATDAVMSLVVACAFILPVYGDDPTSLLMVAGSVVGFVILTAAFRGYDPRRLGDGPEEFQSILRASAAAAALLMAASYATKAEVSRLVVFGGVPVLLLAAAAGRFALRKMVHAQRRRGVAMKRTLLVGEVADVTRIAGELAGATYHGYGVEAVCVPSPGELSDVEGHPVLGSLADTAQIVVDRAIDVVVVAGPGMSGEGLRRLSWALDRLGAQLVVVPDLLEVQGPRISLRPAAGLSLLEVEVAAPRRRLLAKAFMDRAMGAFLLVVAAPVILVAAAAVKLTSRGPAFYSQTRVGLDGTTFTMRKLRSMYVDADQRRGELAEDSDGNGMLFKMRRDPRVTPVGRFLRRYSIDELPQLLNVVLGDMSLVGPRPPLGEEVAQYSDPVHRRLRVRPGLTGLWQVSGRSDLSWEESVRLDLRYVDNWSVAMDLLILWKTWRAVMAGVGAY